MNNYKNAIDVLKNEIECVARRAGNKCNGGTDCQNCDLVLPDFMVLDALRMAVEAIERRTPQKPVEKDGLLYCPNCQEDAPRKVGCVVYPWYENCNLCGQALDWELEKGS